MLRWVTHRAEVAERRLVPYSEAGTLLAQGWELDLEREDKHRFDWKNPTVHLQRVVEHPRSRGEVAATALALAACLILAAVVVCALMLGRAPWAA